MFHFVFIAEAKTFVRSAHGGRRHHHRSLVRSGILAFEPPDRSAWLLVIRKGVQTRQATPTNTKMRRLLILLVRFESTELISYGHRPKACLNGLVQTTNA